MLHNSKHLKVTAFATLLIFASSNLSSYSNSGNNAGLTTTPSPIFLNPGKLANRAPEQIRSELRSPAPTTKASPLVDDGRIRFQSLDWNRQFRGDDRQLLAAIRSTILMDYLLDANVDTSIQRFLDGPVEGLYPLEAYSNHSFHFKKIDESTRMIKEQGEERRTVIRATYKFKVFDSGNKTLVEGRLIVHRTGNLILGERIEFQVNPSLRERFDLRNDNHLWEILKKAIESFYWIRGLTGTKVPINDSRFDGYLLYVSLRIEPELGKEIHEIIKREVTFILSKDGQEIANGATEGIIRYDDSTSIGAKSELRSAELRNKWQYSYAQEQGERKAQEDRFLFEEINLHGIVNGSGILLAVMDGGVGVLTAETLQKNLGDTFKNSLRNSSGNIKKAFEETVETLQTLTQNHDTASTLSMVYLPEHSAKAYAAVLGDSPILILDQKGRLNQSPSHNVRINQSEREAAIKRGALFNGSYIQNPKTSSLGSQLTRTFGFKKGGAIILRTPEIYEVELGDKSFILLASDGLLDSDHLKEQENILRIVPLIQSGATAKELVQDALKRDPRDNITALLFHRSEPQSEEVSIADILKQIHEGNEEAFKKASASINQAFRTRIEWGESELFGQILVAAQTDRITINNILDLHERGLKDFTAKYFLYEKWTASLDALLENSKGDDFLNKFNDFLNRLAEKSIDHFSKFLPWFLYKNYSFEIALIPGSKDWPAEFPARRLVENIYRKFLITKYPDRLNLFESSLPNKSERSYEDMPPLLVDDNLQEIVAKREKEVGRRLTEFEIDEIRSEIDKLGALLKNAWENLEKRPPLLQEQLLEIKGLVRAKQFREAMDKYGNNRYLLYEFIASIAYPEVVNHTQMPNYGFKRAYQDMKELRAVGFPEYLYLESLGIILGSVYSYMEEEEKFFWANTGLDERMVLIQYLYFNIPEFTTESIDIVLLSESTGEVDGEISYKYPLKDRRTRVAILHKLLERVGDATELQHFKPLLEHLLKIEYDETKRSELRSESLGATEAADRLDAQIAVRAGKNIYFVTDELMSALFAHSFYIPKNPQRDGETDSRFWERVLRNVSSRPTIYLAKLQSRQEVEALYETLIRILRFRDSLHKRWFEINKQNVIEQLEKITSKPAILIQTGYFESGWNENFLRAQLAHEFFHEAWRQFFTDTSESAVNRIRENIETYVKNHKAEITHTLNGSQHWQFLENQNLVAQFEEFAALTLFHTFPSIDQNGNLTFSTVDKDSEKTGLELINKRQELIGQIKFLDILWRNVLQATNQALPQVIHAYQTAANGAHRFDGKREVPKKPAEGKKFVSLDFDADSSEIYFNISKPGIFSRFFPVKYLLRVTDAGQILLTRWLRASSINSEGDKHDVISKIHEFLPVSFADENIDVVVVDGRRTTLQINSNLRLSIVNQSTTNGVAQSPSSSNAYHTNRLQKNAFALPEKRFGVKNINLIDTLSSAIEEELGYLPLMSIIGSVSYLQTASGIPDWDAITDIDLRIHDSRLPQNITSEEQRTLFNRIRDRLLRAFKKAGLETFYHQPPVTSPEGYDDVNKWGIRERNGSRKEFYVNLIVTTEKNLFSENRIDSYKPIDYFFGNLDLLNSILAVQEPDAIRKQSEWFYASTLDQIKKDRNLSVLHPPKLQLLKRLYQLAYLTGKEQQASFLIKTYKQLEWERKRIQKLKSGRLSRIWAVFAEWRFKSAFNRARKLLGVPTSTVVVDSVERLKVASAPAIRSELRLTRQSSANRQPERLAQPTFASNAESRSLIAGNPTRTASFKYRTSVLSDATSPLSSVTSSRIGITTSRTASSLPSRFSISVPTSRAVNESFIDGKLSQKPDSVNINNSQLNYASESITSISNFQFSISNAVRNFVDAYAANVRNAASLTDALGTDLSEGDIVLLLPNLARDPAALFALVQQINGKNKVVALVGTQDERNILINELLVHLPNLGYLMEHDLLTITSRPSAETILGNQPANSRILAVGYQTDEGNVKRLKEQLPELHIEDKIVDSLDEALGLVGAIIEKATQNLRAEWLRAIAS